MNQQSYGSYPYYPHYSQTPYMAAAGPSNGHAGYPPFYGPLQTQPPATAPENRNPPAPSAYSFDAEAYTVKHKNGVVPAGASQARRQQHRRMNTVPAHQQPQPQQQAPPAAGIIPPPAGQAPLKSAMKKTITAFNTAENSTRSFFNSFNTQPPLNQTPGMPRPRVYSNPTIPHNLAVEESPDTMDNPFHMIVSFHGYNELRIEHILKLALEEMRKVIWPLWPEGMETDVVVGHTCIARFRSTPWDLSGPNVKSTYKLLAEFFKLFQQRGYSFQTAVSVGSPTPRYIFQVTKPDNAEFFLAFFSQEGRRFTLINPPQHVDLSIGAKLRAAFARKIQSDTVVEEYMRVIEVKRKANSNLPEIDPGMFFVEVLRILNQLGFHLDAAIPLSRRGALGMRNQQREILVFKGVIIKDS